MNANVQPLAAPPVKKLEVQPGQVWIIGRCISAKKSGTLWEHLVVLPAPDLYSSPSTVSVLAKTRQASQEEDVQLLCRVTGYKRSYNKTDQETGERTTVKTADNRLFLVE